MAGRAQVSWETARTPREARASREDVGRLTKHASTRWHQLPGVRRTLASSVVVALFATLVVVVVLIQEGDSTTPVAKSGKPTPTASPNPSIPIPGAVTTPLGTSTDAATGPGKKNSKSTMRSRLASRVEALARQVMVPASFRVASFNVLGHSHTTRGGDKPQYAEGPTRMGMAVSLLRGAQVDVVGFQEYELPQHYAFQRITAGAWGVYPGASMGAGPVRNSIAWRLDTWEAVAQDTIPIPYFRGNRVDMPYVLLEHKGSGRRVWFINIHNPTSNGQRGDNERWRDIGTTLEINLMNQLQSAGTPVILMGDFNERDEPFCRITQQADAEAANGGTASPCQLPSNNGIDWIFGSAAFEFSSYLRLRNALVARATDHPLIAATATLSGLPQ